MESESQGMSRRQVVGTAAWAAPLILFATATPASAASVGDAALVLISPQVRQGPILFDESGSAAPAMIFTYSMSVQDDTPPLTSVGAATVTFPVPGVWTDATQTPQWAFQGAPQTEWEANVVVDGSIASVTLTYVGPALPAGATSGAEFAIRLDASTDLTNTPLPFTLAGTTPAPASEPIDAPDSPYTLLAS